jgi:hypothetical protein
LAGSLCNQTALHRAGKAPRRLRVVDEKHQRLEDLECHEQKSPVLDHAIDPSIDGQGRRCQRAGAYPFDQRRLALDALG